jgi:hypothetical protein
MEVLEMTVLVAVYRDRETAEAVAHELSNAPDVSSEAVRISDAADRLLSVRAEMDAEVAESWGSPGLGAFVTAEMMRGAVLLALLMGAIGVLVGLPIGYFLFVGDASVWEKLGLGAVVGGLFGATVGGLLGGGFAMQSPEEKLAAERGIPVALEDATPAAEEVMARYEPIRLDRFEDGNRVDTPQTEGPEGVTETIAELVANTSDPRRQG